MQAALSLMPGFQGHPDTCVRVTKGEEDVGNCIGGFLGGSLRSGMYLSCPRPFFLRS